MERHVLFGSTGITRFKSRREAEKALSEIVSDGGRRDEFRIEEDPEDGSCVIAILEQDGAVAGTLGA